MYLTKIGVEAKMIRVYFETDSVSEQVATFEDESHYIACLPALKELAKQEGWTHVTESVDEEWEKAFVSLDKTGEHNG